MDVKDKVLTDS